MGLIKEDISNMRVILKEDYLAIPDDVTVSVKARIVTVKGPRGSITKRLNHLPIDIKVLDMSKVKTSKLQGNHVRIQMWLAGYKQACAVTTFKSLIANAITGVTEGFRYKMRLVHAHFPIQAQISEAGKQVEVKNFLGGKKGHLINLQPGCTVQKSKEFNTEIIFDGIDNAKLSLSCAQVSQVCKVGRKDMRKFLDGIYVSEKTLTDPKEE